MHSTRKGSMRGFRSTARRSRSPRLLLAGILGLALAGGWGFAWLASARAGPGGLTIPAIIVDGRQAEPILWSIRRILEDPESAAVIDDLMQTGSLFHIGTAPIQEGDGQLSHSFMFAGKGSNFGRLLLAKFRTERVGDSAKVSPPAFSYATHRFPAPVETLAAGRGELDVLKALVRDPDAPTFLGQVFAGQPINYICVAPTEQSDRFNITLLHERQDAEKPEKSIVEAVQTEDGFDFLFDDE